jgi:hypothetical protein
VGEKEKCRDFQTVVISGTWINLKKNSESCGLKFQIHSMNENIFAAKIPVFLTCQKFSCCVLLGSTKFGLYHDIQRKRREKQAKHNYTMFILWNKCKIHILQFNLSIESFCNQKTFYRTPN